MNSARRMKIATQQWLKNRLSLEISEEKSKITDLKCGYSEFLGIKFKLYQKSQKWCIKSHMTDKAIKAEKTALKEITGEGLQRLWKSVRTTHFLSAATIRQW